MTTYLTARHKNMIRDQACALCLALPPFADGSRCHVHRIVRGKDGGQYVADNVIPLCPSCHRAVDGIACITSARHGGLRTHALHPEHAQNAGRQGGIVLGERKRSIGLTPAEVEHLRSAGRASAAKHTFEMRSMWGTKGGKIGGPRVHAMHPDHARRAGQRTMALHPDQARQMGLKGGRKGAQATILRHKMYGLTQKEIERNRQAAFALNAKLTTAKRIAAARKAWITRRGRRQVIA